MNEINKLNRNRLVDREQADSRQRGEGLQGCVKKVRAIKQTNKKENPKQKQRTEKPHRYNSLVVNKQYNVQMSYFKIACLKPM